MWYLAFFGSAFLPAMIPGANNAVIMRQTVRRRIEQVTGLVLVGLGARLMLDTR